MTTKLHVFQRHTRADLPVAVGGDGMYLYDKDGKVVFKYFGAIKPADLRSAIDKALGNKP